jgi:lipopolysaccharide transport system permease protein
MLFAMKSEIRHFWELLWAMTEKELRSRYKYTIFGFFWLVANPLLQMIVIYFIFSLFIKEPIPNYPYYLFIGLLIWNFFSISLTKGTPSIVNERSLIKKAKFPRAVIPLSIILSNFIHFLLALILFLIPVLFLGTLFLTRIPQIFFGLVLLLVFTVGLSLLTSALNVRFRDINFFVQALLIIWFYATPIVYSISVIPYKFMWLWRLNPMTSVVQLMQYGFLGASPPGIGMLSANIGATIMIFLLGLSVFRSESRNFDDWV